MIVTLKKSSHFKEVLSNGKKVATKGMVVVAINQKCLDLELDKQIYLGYIASKKLGNAVVRNRIKRRLRAVVKEVLSPIGNQSLCYVIIGRKAAFDRPYDNLKKDLKYAYHQFSSLYNMDDDL